MVGEDGEVFVDLLARHDGAAGDVEAFGTVVAATGIAGKAGIRVTRPDAALGGICSGQLLLVIVVQSLTFQADLRTLRVLEVFVSTSSAIRHQRARIKTEAIGEAVVIRRTAMGVVLRVGGVSTRHVVVGR